VLFFKSDAKICRISILAMARIVKISKKIQLPFYRLIVNGIAASITIRKPSKSKKAGAETSTPAL
jgi:hypothetical protein